MLFNKVKRVVFFGENLKDENKRWVEEPKNGIVTEHSDYFDCHTKNGNYFRVYKDGCSGIEIVFYDEPNGE